MNFFLRIFSLSKKQKTSLMSSKIDISNQPICQAPFKSLRFEPLGVMRTCCYNIQVVAGVYPKQTLLEAWNSSEMNLLREKVKKQDLSFGCRLCADQLNNGEENTVKYLQYENLPESEHNFPVMLDFSLHNTCNLGCVMCHGEFSSSIRKNREHLPPMKMVYDETFVEQLHPFIKHAKQFVFAGGEPFLIDIHYAIWDRIVELNPEVTVHVVTNGTVFNKKVQRVFSQLKFNVTISIDAFDKEIYELIRINASFDKVMNNFQYFKSYCEEKKTQFAINVCPIKQNRLHLPEMLLYCNRNQIRVNFLYVVHPASSTLQALDVNSLKELSLLYSSYSFVQKTETEKQNWEQFQELILRVNGWIIKKEKQSTNKRNEERVLFSVFIDTLMLKTTSFYVQKGVENDKETIQFKIKHLEEKFSGESLPLGRIKEIESLSPERVVALLRSSSVEDLYQTIENIIL